MSVAKNRGEILFLAALVIVFATQVFFFARSTSATFDENSHLPAGYTYLRWHDYRLNPEHPPLVKKLAAIPLLWTEVWPATAPEPALPGDNDDLLRAGWTAAI